MRRVSHRYEHALAVMIHALARHYTILYIEVFNSQPLVLLYTISSALTYIKRIGVFAVFCGSKMGDLSQVCLIQLVRISDSQ